MDTKIFDVEQSIVSSYGVLQFKYKFLDKRISDAMNARYPTKSGNEKSWYTQAEIQRACDDSRTSLSLNVIKKADLKLPTEQLAFVAKAQSFASLF